MPLNNVSEEFLIKQFI